ncbi:MAG: molybdate ABC transporter permease subunit [Deltaproteobacteria bacterium]|nr:molybdate ABC transporter permease subunit [Deltaproteobacteria bacterium]
MERLFSLPLIIIILSVIGVMAALIFQVTPSEIFQAVSSAEILFSMRLSLTTSLMAVSFSILLGIPAAYLMARRNFFGKTVIDLLLDLPLVMPPLVAGVGLLFLFGEHWIGGILADFGLRLIFTPWGAVAAQIFIALPILIRSCRAAFEAVNSRYELAGYTLGLSPFQVFFLVTLPLARKGLLSGMILAWARALGEFGATLMVAGATRFKTATLPISVYLNISSGELGLALACALLLLFSGLILLIVLKWISRDRNAGTPIEGI